MRGIRIVIAGLVGAVLTGLVLGVVARILMRVVAVAAGSAGELSLSGSVFIPLIYALAMLPAALTAAFTTSRWRWIPGAAGALFLCVPAVSVASEELGSTDGFSALQWFGVSAASLAVFATIFLAPVVTVRLVDKLRGRGGRTMDSRSSQPVRVGDSV